MKVNYAPNNYQPDGTVSFLSWSNNDLIEAIRRAFCESPREQIIELVIEREGLKAVFKKF